MKTMAKKKNKGFDPLDFTIKHGQITMGTQMMIGTTGLIEQRIPGTHGVNIMQGMNTMGLLPTVHATGGVFQSLHMLSKAGKKR